MSCSEDRPVYSPELWRSLAKQAIGLPAPEPRRIRVRKDPWAPPGRPWSASAEISPGWSHIFYWRTFDEAVQSADSLARNFR